MKEILQQFIVIYIIIFSILMIYNIIRNKSKKFKDIPTTGMLYLINLYGIDIKNIGINIVQKHLSIVNSFIITTDLLIYYHVKSMILKLIIIFVVTFILIYIGYSILANIYRKRR